MVAGFIPSKLLKLLSSQYFTCNNLPTYTIGAIEEFISDFYVSKEYNVLLPTIRHKKLDVISTYFYQSLKSLQYRKELLKQLRIFNLYFFFVREYREDIRKFTNNIRKCKIISKQYSKITKPAKISLKKLTSTKNLLVFSKSLVEQTNLIPLKIDNTLQAVSIPKHSCKGNYCYMYIEAKEGIEIDPDFTLLRLLKINELIPSFKSLTLNNEISLKIISKSKRNWRVIDDFIKTLRKFAEIKLSPKESAELTIIIYEGDTKFF
jgi:hypothetical protein